MIQFVITDISAQVVTSIFTVVKKSDILDYGNCQSTRFHIQWDKEHCISLKAHNISTCCRKSDEKLLGLADFQKQVPLP